MCFKYLNVDVPTTRDKRGTICIVEGQYIRHCDDCSIYKGNEGLN